MTKTFDSAYRNYALRQILDMPHGHLPVVPPAAIEVWDRLNDRAVVVHNNYRRRLAKSRTHALALEAKLAERRKEFKKEFVTCLFFSGRGDHVFAQPGEHGTLVLPVVEVKLHFTVGQAYKDAGLRQTGAYYYPPAEFSVSRSIVDGANHVNSLLFAKVRAFKSDKAPLVGGLYYPCDHESFSVHQRQIFKLLQENFTVGVNE